MFFTQTDRDIVSPTPVPRGAKLRPTRTSRRARACRPRHSLVLLTTLLAALLFTGGGEAASTGPLPPTAAANPMVEVGIGGETFAVEVVSSRQQRARGLMYRTYLAADRGMLFLFPRPRQLAFWMKNTLIPLDILFFDAGHRVSALHHSVPPCTAKPCPHYPADTASDLVLELRAGTAARLGIKKGSHLRLPASLKNRRDD